MGGRPFDSAAHGPAASILLCPSNIAREQVPLARLIAPIPSAARVPHHLRPTYGRSYRASAQYSPFQYRYCPQLRGRGGGTSTSPGDISIPPGGGRYAARGSYRPAGGGKYHDGAKATGGGR